MATIERREFLKLVGAGGVGAGAGFMLAEVNKHPVEQLVPYAIPPEEFSPGIATWYNTVCALCSAGCGISVRTREGRAKKIEGNPSHPVNQGKLCALGQAGLQVLYNPDRVIGPMRRSGARGAASFVPVTWGEAQSEIADRLELLRAAGRGDRIALVTGGVRGHLASLFERFMQSLGSERLLHYDFDHPHTLYAANERLFGQAVLPYYDIENAQYLLSFGADFLGTWLSPVHQALGFGRSRQGGAGRIRCVQIEPRMSLSGAAADEWLPANPGTEGLLALALARRIVASGAYDGADRDDWAAALDAHTPASVAEQTGIEAATITRIADEFAGAERALAIGGGAAANHTNGADTLVAINVLNFLAGNLGRQGGVVFNPPPAIGAASHARQAGYRGLSALAEDARRGDVEVLIVNDANPVFTMPPAAGFAEALGEIPLIVSLGSFVDETTAMADFVLPSHTYLESWGDDVPEPGVGFSVGALSQPVVAPLYDTRATGDIVIGIARDMGLTADFPWADMQERLRDGWREIYQRGAPGAEAGEFEAFWHSVLRAGVWGTETRATQDPPAPDVNLIARVGVGDPQFAGSREEYPYVLHPYLSTSLHDGRGANLPWMQELPDALTSVVYGSWIELNPVTAEALGLREGDVVDVESTAGRISVPVYVFPAIRPDVVAMPIGQGHTRYGRYARDRGVNPIAILAPQLEAATGELAWAATRVRLTATGRHVELTKTSGESRELGREIVQTAPQSGRETANTLESIPITVVRA